MNLLVLGIAAFMLLFMLRGYRIGLFKSAAGAIGIVLAVFLTALLYPGVNKLLCEQTALDETIKNNIIKKFELPQETEEITRNQEIELIDKLDLPTGVRDWLIENCNGEQYLETGVNNVCGYAWHFVCTYIFYFIFVYSYFNYSSGCGKLYSDRKRN